LKNDFDYHYALNSITRTSYELLTNYRIDLILYNDFPHTPLEIVMYFLARIMCIETYFLFSIPRIDSITERFMLTNDFSRLPSEFWKIYNNQKNSENIEDSKISLDLQNYYLEYSGNIKSNKYYFGNKTNKFKLLTRYLRRLPINISEQGTKKTLIKALNRLQYLTMIHNFKKNKILNYGARLSVVNPKIDEEAFLFFPLHYQPEANTIPWGNIYSDQLSTIIELSYSIPNGYILYVKEHPTYWTLNHIENFELYRSKDFYKKITQLHNVRLISHKIPSYELIEKAKCIITVTGTIAWESFFRSVPCIVLGDIYYKEFPTSVSPENFNYNLSLTIKEALSRIGNDYSLEFKKFLVTFDKTTLLTKNPLAISHDWDRPYLKKEEEYQYSSTNKIKAEFIFKQLK
jgi:hypothetical protein